MLVMIVCNYILIYITKVSKCQTTIKEFPKTSFFFSINSVFIYFCVICEERYRIRAWKGQTLLIF